MKGLYKNVNNTSVYVNRRGSLLVAERPCSMKLIIIIIIIVGNSLLQKSRSHSTRWSSFVSRHKPTCCCSLTCMRWPLIQWEAWGYYSHGDKRQGNEDHHSPLPSVWLINAWSFIFTAPYMWQIHEMGLIKFFVGLVDPIVGTLTRYLLHTEMY